MAKPQWLVVLVILARAYIAKAAAVEPRAVIHGFLGSITDSPTIGSASTGPVVEASIFYETDISGTSLQEVYVAPGTVTIGPATDKPCTCRARRRQEWRKMSSAERFSYIHAVQCLQGLKPVGGISGSRSRFDDFQGLHAQLMHQVHLVGQFLPWHRYFLVVYESTMREECGYKGAQPYWDWTLDTNNFPESPVFDPVTGFGSLILGGRGPVEDGPFATYQLIFGTGPPPNITEHKLERGFNPAMLQHITQNQVDCVLSQPTFERFRIELEGRHVTSTPRPHDGGHHLVGGDLADPWSSPGDPLFYLHHANIDRIWWQWQKSWPGRLYEISGRTTERKPSIEVTLDFVLSMGKLGNSTTIGNIMDIENTLCYTYI